MCRLYGCCEKETNAINFIAKSIALKPAISVFARLIKRSNLFLPEGAS